MIRYPVLREPGTDTGVNIHRAVWLLNFVNNYGSLKGKCQCMGAKHKLLHAWSLRSHIQYTCMDVKVGCTHGHLPRQLSSKNYIPHYQMHHWLNYACVLNIQVTWTISLCNFRIEQHIHKVSSKVAQFVSWLELIICKYIWVRGRTGCQWVFFWAIGSYYMWLRWMLLCIFSEL